MESAFIFESDTKSKSSLSGLGDFVSATDEEKNGMSIKSPYEFTMLGSQKRGVPGSGGIVYKPGKLTPPITGSITHANAFGIKSKYWEVKRKEQKGHDPVPRDRFYYIKDSDQLAFVGGKVMDEPTVLKPLSASESKYIRDKKSNWSEKDLRMFIREYGGFKINDERGSGSSSAYQHENAQNWVDKNINIIPRLVRKNERTLTITAPKDQKNSAADQKGIDAPDSLIATVKSAPNTIVKNLESSVPGGKYTLYGGASLIGLLILKTMFSNE